MNLREALSQIPENIGLFDLDGNTYSAKTLLSTLAEDWLACETGVNQLFICVKKDKDIMIFQIHRGTFQKDGSFVTNFWHNLG